PLNKTLWFIRPILEGKADFVIGNRFSGRMEKGAMSVVNVVGNKFITSNVNLLFHVGVWDTQCGMRAFTRDAFRKMSLKCTGMEFGPELVIEAHAKGLRLKELPIDYRKRGGAAKLNALRDGIRDITYLYKRFLGFA
ncbi:MAG TPA: glycosyltransferase family 2 protein, partial [archaeon]|nr:glycosyltransferase family 2 protein [archaeon]